MPITLVEVMQMGIELVARAEKAEAQSKELAKQVELLTAQLKQAETTLHEAKAELEHLDQKRVT